MSRTRLHRVYKDDAYPQPVLDLTLKLIKMRPWQKGADPAHLFDVWVHGASLVYELPRPTIVFDPPRHLRRDRPQIGEYEEPEGTERNPFGIIVLRRWSVISLLHQYRHHMQHHSDHEYASIQEQGEDAQAWACSLFYAVAPRRFRRMVRAGRVVGVKPEDLLKRKVAA